MENLSEKQIEQIEQLDDLKIGLFRTLNDWAENKKSETIKSAPFVFLQIFAEGVVELSDDEISEEKKENYHESLDRYIEIAYDKKDESKSLKDELIINLKNIRLKNIRNLIREIARGIEQE